MAGTVWVKPHDEPYLLAVVRYIERNPVHARMVHKPWDYPWSSADSHITKAPDPVLSESFLTEQIPDWRAFLQDSRDDKLIQSLEHHASTGRPLGNESFLKRLEILTGRQLQRKRPGPRPGGQR